MLDEAGTLPAAIVHKQIKCLTWNCEGFRRVISDLFSICHVNQPDFIFISVPWLFQSDLSLATVFFQPNYCSSLNSDNKFDNELALTTSHAHGGTLTLLKIYLDPFITVIPVTTNRFLIIVLNIPDYPITVHINVYLPTSGLDEEFVHELSKHE